MMNENNIPPVIDQPPIVVYQTNYIQTGWTIDPHLGGLNPELSWFGWLFVAGIIGGLIYFGITM